MHIDNRPLTDTAADVHDRADGQSTLDVQQPARLDRRRILGKAAMAAPVVAAGAALGPLANLIPRAAAAEAPSDFDLLGFYQTIELSAAQIYTSATAKLTGEAATAVGAFAEHHNDHAAAFADMITKAGLTPPGASNPGVDRAYAGRATSAGDSAGVLAVLYDLESALAATYFAALGVIENGAAAATIAAILPVDAQHAVVIGTALGRSVDELVADAQTDAGALAVAQYPVPVKADSGASTDSGTTQATS